jgi:hypothetical protein
MRTAIQITFWIPLAIIAGCTSLPETIEKSGEYKQWVQDIREQRSKPMNIRVAGYNSAIFIGIVATIDTNNLNNSGIAKGLILDRPRVLQSEFGVGERQVTLLFASPADLKGVLPITGEEWVVYARANAKGHWFVHGALKVNGRSNQTGGVR